MSVTRYAAAIRFLDCSIQHDSSRFIEHRSDRRDTRAATLRAFIVRTE